MVASILLLKMTLSVTASGPLHFLSLLSGQLFLQVFAKADFLPFRLKPKCHFFRGVFPDLPNFSQLYSLQDILVFISCLSPPAHKLFESMNYITFIYHHVPSTYKSAGHVDAQYIFVERVNDMKMLCKVLFLPKMLGIFLFHLLPGDGRGSGEVCSFTQFGI